MWDMAPMLKRWDHFKYCDSRQRMAQFTVPLWLRETNIIIGFITILRRLTHRFLWFMAMKKTR